MKYRCSIGKSGFYRVEAEHIINLIRKALEIPIYIELVVNGTDCHHIIDVIPEEATYDKSFLLIYTSGTTGTAKPVKIDIVAALHNKKGHGSPTERWLLTYEPWRWAGISVMLHVIKHNATLVIPENNQSLDISACLNDVTHVSFTPSLFKKILMSSSRTVWENIQHVTFGGEYVTQPILDLAGKSFPGARISHVYATTETGDICAVSDGREGYPPEKMRNCLIRNDGVLVVDGIPTNDIWRIEQGRYKFVGRMDDIINVGGAKVSLIEVEQCIEAHEKITNARCYAIASPLLGHGVGVEYTGDITKHELKNYLKSRLPRHSIPIQFKPVDFIALTSAGKKKR